MNLIIDCNVFISAVLGSETCQTALAEAFLRHSVFYSDETLSELETVVRKDKFKKFRVKSETVIDMLKQCGMRVIPAKCPNDLPDPDDEIYLGTALAVMPAVIVTGNARHFPEELCCGVPVLNPRAFLKRYDQT